ncbi:MAG: hypothetical protein K9N35_03480 [Candidatus Marinimicrobia bacterium]|nr:hypothetical protein [Candidatus Neomarinimicrobiota bacterium]
MNLKNRNQIIWLLIPLIAAFFVHSCSSESRDLKLEMQISELICDDGLHIFEGRILELEGIKSVTANIETGKVIITFHEKSISAQEIKTHLSEFGFTIDGEAGNQIARKRLPSCCLE